MRTTLRSFRAWMCKKKTHIADENIREAACLLMHLTLVGGGAGKSSFECPHNLKRC